MEVSSFTPLPLYPRGLSPLGGPQSGYVHGGEEKSVACGCWITLFAVTFIPPLGPT